MSDDITFKELLDLPEKFFKGQSEITREATIKKALEPREVKGTKDGRDYHFFSQFLVLNDKTADIGVDVTIGKAEDACKEGMMVRLENGKADTYKDKKGETQRKLRGKITIVNKTSQPGVSNNGYKAPRLEKPIMIGDYYIALPPNGKVELAPEIDRQHKLRLLREGIAKSFIETTAKWNKTIEEQAEKSFDWVCRTNSKPESKVRQKQTKEETKKPEEKKTSANDTAKEEVKEKPDNNESIFDREAMLKEFSKQYIEAFKLGILNKDFNVKHWLSQHYNKELPGQLTDSELWEAVVKMEEEVEEVKGQAKEEGKIES